MDTDTDSKVGFQIEIPAVQGGYNAHSRYALFLIEQLIVILIFALCAAICVSIFADSYVMAGSSSNLNYAMTMAESGAECFKAVGDDTDRLARLLGGVNDADTVRVFYSRDWQVSSRDNAVYAMTLEFRGGEHNLLYCDVSVDKINDENIIAFTVASQRK